MSDKKKKYFTDMQEAVDRFNRVIKDGEPQAELSIALDAIANVEVPEEFKRKKPNRAPAVRRVSKDDLSDWKDPYGASATASDGPSWLEKEFTPAELAEQTRKTRKHVDLYKEHDQDVCNIPRRLRLELFLNEWKMAVSGKRVAQNDDMDKLYMKLCCNGTEFSKMTGGSDNGITSDIEKIVTCMEANNVVVNYAIKELIKTKKHRSLSVQELNLVASDWIRGYTPDHTSIEGIVGEFGLFDINKDVAVVGISSPEAALLAEALFDGHIKQKNEIINDMATELIRQFDSNLLAELDERRMALFKRLAATSFELAEITKELFQERTETEFERKRREKRNRVIGSGMAIQRSPSVKEEARVSVPAEKVEEPQVSAEEPPAEGGWKVPLASLLVAAVAKAAQSHFKQNETKPILETVEAKNG